MGSGIRSREYRNLARKILQSHGITLRQYILKRTNQDGVRATDLAYELGMPRQRLYYYAKALGIDLGTRPLATDVWEQMGLSGDAPATGTEG